LGHDQLPLVVVCEVVAPEEVALLAVELLELLEVPEVVAAVEAEPSSDSVFEEVAPDTVAAFDLVLTAAVCADVALWSCQASTPPSDTMAATLSAAAALRALAARGLRFPAGRAGTRRGAGPGWGVAVGSCSFMSTKVRTPDEGVARAG
jgi:hypothetical protein